MQSKYEIINITTYKNLELLQARGQIWRPAEQVIRGKGKFVVFCCRGKHTENTPATDG
jgi:hypothetical protein